MNKKLQGLKLGAARLAPSHLVPEHRQGITPQVKSGVDVGAELRVLRKMVFISLFLFTFPKKPVCRLHSARTHATQLAAAEHIYCR